MDNRSITFRPICDDDMEFLYRVYACSREEELAQTPWNDDEKHQFLEMQFTAQHTHYQKYFDDAQFDLILIDGEPVGRLYVRRRDDEIRIVDIALLPEQRGTGIGGGIMKDLLAEAAAANKPARIHVEQNNPAMHLYERLGFRKTGDTGVYFLMEWSPTNSQPTGNSR